MSFLWVLVWVLMVLFMIFIGFILDCLYKNKGTKNIWSCVFRAEPSGDTPKDSKGSKKVLCEFEGEDLFNNKVYALDGTLITEQPDKMTCDECSNYIYKGSSDDECYDMGYDKEYQSKGTVVGVCSAAFTKKSCPF